MPSPTFNGPRPREAAVDGSEADDESTAERPLIDAAAFSSPALTPVPLEDSGALPTHGGRPAAPLEATLIHAAPASAATTPCEICGAPTTERLCADCAPPASAASSALLATPPAAPASPRSAAPAASSPKGKGRLWLPILLVAILLAAGAAAAYVFVLRDDASGPKTAAAPTGATGRATSAPDVATTPTAAPARDDRLDVGPTPRPTASAGVDDVGSGPEFSKPTAPKSSAAVPGPVAAMREHWNAIGAQDLETAYGRFVTQYPTPFARWSADNEDFAPAIAIASVRLQDQLSPSKAIVRLAIATRDRGPMGNPARCHIFSGKVLVIRQDGGWRYDPNGLSKGSFGTDGPIRPSADDRCAPLF